METNEDTIPTEATEATEAESTLVPSNSMIDRLMRIANAVAESGSALPKGCRNAAGVFRKMLTGVELGLPPMTSLNELDSINGRETLSARMKVAIIRKRKIGKIEVVETTAESATVAVSKACWPDDRQEQITFTMDDARTAKISEKDNWKHWPKAMLLSKALSIACATHFQEVFEGVGYTADDLGAETDEEGRVLERLEPTTAETPPWRKKAEDETVEKEQPPQGKAKPTQEPPALPKAAQKPATSDVPPAAATAGESNYQPHDTSPGGMKRAVKEVGLTADQWRESLANHFNGAKKLADLTLVDAERCAIWLRRLKQITLMREDAGYGAAQWASVLAKRQVDHEHQLSLDQVHEIWSKLFENTTPFRRGKLGITEENAKPDGADTGK